MEKVELFTSNDVVSALDEFVTDNVRYFVTPLEKFDAGKFPKQPTVMFVDWLLHDMSGLEMCRRLRSRPHLLNLYIVVVLEVETIEQRSRAMAAGADDYMSGPLDINKLHKWLVNHRNIVRSRYLKDTTDKFPVLDHASLSIGYKNRFTSLSRSEFRLLEVLLDFSGRVGSRAQVINDMTAEERPQSERTVDQWIARLRAKLVAIELDHALRTVRDKGYIFDALVQRDGQDTADDVGNPIVCAV